MISADLSRMYARALEEQRRGRDIEKAKRERIEAEAARLDAERIRISEASLRRKHKRRLKTVILGKDPDRPGELKFVRRQGRQIGEPRMPPIAFERKVNKFIELYQSIPADQRLRGTDGDPIFDFMLNKHTLADMYAAKTGKRLSRYSLKRVMEAACVKV